MSKKTNKARSHQDRTATRRHRNEERKLTEADREIVGELMGALLVAITFGALQE